MRSKTTESRLRGIITSANWKVTYISVLGELRTDFDQLSYLRRPQPLANTFGCWCRSPEMGWIDEAVSAPIRPVRPEPPSSRVFGALRRASENVSQIARDRAMGRIWPPPDGVFHAGSFFGTTSTDPRRPFPTAVVNTDARKRNGLCAVGGGPSVLRTSKLTCRGRR